jgi:anti-sigma factor RsiW
MTARRAPRPPARCLALLGRLSRYIDDELTPPQRRAIDAHCRDCSRCQRMIAGLQRTVALCRRAGSTAAMPARARARARARIVRLLSGGKPRTAE